MANSLMNYLIPEDMQQYLSYYGYHFNKKLCDFAVGKMMKEDKATGAMKHITPMSLEELKSLLEKHKITVDTNEIYDALFAANMCKADYLGSSVPDEEHLAKYVEDVLCDPDAVEGQTFARFLADCSIQGCVIFWDLML